MKVRLAGYQQVVLTIAAIAACLFMFIYNALCAFHTCYDAGWIIQTGDHILQHGIPRVDIFSWTHAGQPLIAYQWLFSAVLALLFRGGSLWLVGLFTSILIGILVLYVLPRNWMNRGIPAFLPFLLIALTVTPTWFNARPQLVSFFMLFAFVAILERYRLAAAEKKWLFVLPVLMVLWANIHLFCFVGIAIIAVYFACNFFRSRQIDMPLLTALLLSLVATLVNPYGPAVPMHFWSFIDSGQYFRIDELKPWLCIPQFFWSLTIVPVVITVATRLKKHIPAEGYVLMFASLLAALAMVRFEPVFVIVSWQYLGLALSAVNWSAITEKPPAVTNSFRLRLLIAAFVSAVLVWCLECPTQSGAWIALTDGAYPFLSTIYKNYVRATDRVFSTPVVGSWLIAMGPYPVFIDTRYDMYPKAFVAETANCLDGGKGSLESLDKWKISQVITNDDYPLTLRLLSSPNWRPVLDDGILSWWMRCSADSDKQVDNWGLSDSKISGAHLAPYIINATTEFRTARYLMLAKAYHQNGQIEAASDAISKGLQLMPKSPGLLKEQELLSAAKNH